MWTKKQDEKCERCQQTQEGKGKDLTHIELKTKKNKEKTREGLSKEMIAENIQSSSIQTYTI